MVTPCPQGTSQFMVTKRQIEGSIKKFFENDHRHGDHVMVGDVDHCFRFFQNWHTPELVNYVTR